MKKQSNDRMRQWAQRKDEEVSSYRAGLELEKILKFMKLKAVSQITGVSEKTLHRIRNYEKYPKCKLKNAVSVTVFTDGLHELLRDYKNFLKRYDKYLDEID